MTRVAWKEHAPLSLLLFVSFGLRVILLLQGGQNFFPDEARYTRSLSLLGYLAHGQLKGALNFILEAPDHNGFMFAGLLPAVVHGLASRVLRSRGWSPESAFQSTSWVVSVFLSLASVACIGLIYAIARRAGADKREGLAAAFLMACANTIFYTLVTCCLMTYRWRCVCSLCGWVWGRVEALGVQPSVEDWPGSPS